MTNLAGDAGADANEDPLAKLERLVNARTARMAQEGARREPALAHEIAGPAWTDEPSANLDPAGFDATLDLATGLDAELADELAALTGVAQDQHAPQAEEFPAILPSLAALRGGLFEGDDTLGTNAAVVPETEDDPLGSFENELNGAVENALAAATAALAATGTRAVDPELPTATHPLALPSLPAHHGEPSLAAEEVDILTEFERELADEVFHIDEPVDAGEDPLIGVPAPSPTASAADFETIRVVPANDNGTRRRAGMIAALVGGVAVLGAVGSTMLGGSVAGPTEMAVVRADSEPYKKKPADPGGRKVANLDNPVYERVADATGAQALAKPETKLVDRAEDVSEVRVAPVAAPKDDDRLRAVDTAIDVAAPGRVSVTPRVVRTLRVGPDGKLIDGSVRPQASAPAVEAQTPIGAEQRVVPSEVAAEAVEDDARPLKVAGIPVPLGRPASWAGEPVRAEPALAAPVPAEPAAAATTEQEPIVPGGFVVQIASVPSADAARSTYDAMAGRYASLLSGRGVDYQVAEIDGRGTFHRVRIPAISRADANALCSSLKAAGGSCFVTR